MRLHRLTVTAFGPFRSTQTIDFDELSSGGLFLLHGPTGAGKTSVLDAVCFALYGKVPGSREKFTGTLRSDHADPHTLTEVELDFTVGGRRLEITRRPEQLRPKLRGSGLTQEKAFTSLREYVASSGDWKALSRSHQEIGEEIKQLLGDMSREQFCQVVLLPQGDFARFLRADAEARGKLLGQLFDTGRFRDAEQRLGELRRAAGERVRQRDGELLAQAHRMAGAAGSCADLRDLSFLAEPSAPQSLTELAPGDPHLPLSVLQWAAVARTSAREHLAAAEAAVTAAEYAHRAASGAAVAARETARLQRQYAEARRRAGALADQRTETDRARSRLERARAAGSVAPVLALREEAAREHREATEAERHSRAELPADCADAGAVQLAALERSRRTELGGLEAARSAERRAAALDEQLVQLDREAGADEELLQEMGEWLDGWDARRDRLRQEIDTAQDAATRAEQLDGHFRLAESRLEAGRRRDALAAEAREAEERVLQAREAAVTVYERWLDLRKRRLDGMAAELAAGLEDGEPCAVCGSREHPDPARADAGHIDPATEEAALADHRRAEAVRDQADRAAQLLRKDLAVATAASGDTPVAELSAAAEELRAEHAEAQKTASRQSLAREALHGAEREHADRLHQRREAERRTASRTATREALLAERTELEKEIAQARGESAGVDQRAALLERETVLLAAAVDAVRHAEVTAQRLKEADARTADAAYRARFDTPQAAADAVLGEVEQQALQQRLDQWQAEEAAVTAALADREAAEAANLPPVDPDAARAAEEAAALRLREASAGHDAARTRCAELDRLSAQATALARRLHPLRAEYDRIAGLAALTAGTSADNELRMRLEAYVLAARLEQVAAAASLRLSRMSSGRYTLVHSDEKTGGRGRHGLGLHVVDAWTGRERDTATLSGGETFFASLALALGLADVVTDEAGGIRLDTLFIDEGFGSLDEQTLDEVLDVLDSLRERDRCVGIVSHVADLRQRIPARLEVRKSPGGSTVCHHSSPAGG